MEAAAGRHGHDRLATLDSEGRNEWVKTYTHYHTQSGMLAQVRHVTLNPSSISHRVRIGMIKVVDK
jgi:hypothetical protein